MERRTKQQDGIEIITAAHEKFLTLAKKHLHIVNGGATVPVACKSLAPCMPNGRCYRGCCTLWICQDCGVNIKIEPVRTLYGVGTIPAQQSRHVH